ncbi:FtsB family cell division protein [Flavobacterium sp. RHBU_3]|uniref:FtsB family cell division protein n=1 Tax=Flavobacterium sp. RHBU_3 TaxID=3391184 RepID=UPI003984A330
MEGEKKSLFSKYPVLKVLSNRYVLVMVFVGLWLIFLDNYSYFEHRSLNKEIQKLEDKKEYYTHEIKEDSTAIRQLKNGDQTERYAREKYYMKRDDEDIYIIEFEEDAPKVEDTTSL